MIEEEPAVTYEELQTLIEHARGCLIEAEEQRDEARALLDQTRDLLDRCMQARLRVLGERDEARAAARSLWNRAPRCMAGCDCDECLAFLEAHPWLGETAQSKEDG